MRLFPLFLALALSQATLTAAAPSITAATPNQVDAGGPAFTLNVNGSNFVQGSIVNWGATPLATTFNGTGMMFATVPANLTALSGRFVLTVTNPDRSVSDPYANLYVEPVLSAINPGTGSQGNAALTVTATGAGFTSTSLVIAYSPAGSNFLTTTYINSTTLIAVIPAGLMASTGVLRLGIFDDTAGVSSSNVFNFNVGAGNPNLSFLSPLSATMGDAPFTLTVNGSGFVAGAVVHWAASPDANALSTALATNFVGSTQLTATVPSSATARAGTMFVNVTNPAGAGPSNFLSFLVAVAVPKLTSLSPASAPVGSAPFNLTVDGSAFVPAAAVFWNGSALATTFVSSTRLTAAVPASALATAGNVSVTVANQTGGMPSNPLSFLVASAPPPSAAQAAPDHVDAGGPAVAVTVGGSNFAQGAIVNWGSTPLATTFLSSTQLTASVPANLTTLATRVSLSVKNPDNSVSGGIPFAVLPVLAAINPSSAPGSAASLTVTLTGAGFTRNCGVAVEKSSLRNALPVTYVSSTTLLAALDGFVLSSPGSWSVTVVDATAGSSRPALFVVSVSTPVIASLSPTSMPGRGTDFPLTVNGTGFVSGSQVAWNGAKLNSLYSAPGQLTATIPGALTAAPGVASVTVVNPDGAQSPPVSFQVAPVTPVITGLNPTFGYAGGPAFTITASGINFVAGSTLMWGTTALTTTLVSSSQLTAIVPPELTALSAAVRVTVMNPGGAQSYLEFAAIYRVEPVLSAISPSSVNAGDPSVSITATGIGFVAGDGLTFNGTGFPSTWQSSTTLTGAIPASLVITPGTASIQVINLDNQTVSRSLTLTILPGPIPQVTSLSPASWIAGGAAFTLTVNGAGFSSGATVRWNATALSTTFVSGSQLQALVPANLLAVAGNANITVANPQGAASAGAAFPVVPSSGPAVTTAAPDQVDAGAPAFSLTVTGANFVNGSAVYWALTPLATTFSSSTQLSAQVPASLLTTSGKFNITVRNPDGAVSNGSAAVFVQPVLVSMNTNTLAIGAGTTLFASGIGFASSNYLRLTNPAGTSFDLATTLVSPTALAATVPASAVASSGAYMVGVMDPSGAFSRSYSLTVVAALQLTSLSPASAIAGGAAFTLTLNGSGFTGATTVHWNATALSVTYTSGSQLQALVPAALIAAAGSVTVSAEDLLLAERATASFAVNANTPLPTTSAAGIVNAASSLPSIAPGSLISIYGTSLAASRVQALDVPLPTTLGATSVSVNGTLVPLLFVSPGQINAQLPFDTTAGTARVVVHSDGLNSAPVNVPVSATGPGVMTLLFTSHALAVNVSDGSLNSAERPVKSGEYFTAYVTGQGLVDHPVATGAAAPSSPFSLPLAPVQVRIGGQAADIQFAGLAPGFVGLLQLNVLVPNVAAGEQKFEVVIGGVPASPTVISVGGQ